MWTSLSERRAALDGGVNIEACVLYNYIIPTDLGTHKGLCIIAARVRGIL